ncbi:hypothetical protein [Stagnimonas aquatica]|nr:hypothetical protein [Stagnimonas aquatica]
MFTLSVGVLLGLYLGMRWAMVGQDGTPFANLAEVGQGMHLLLARTQFLDAAQPDELEAIRKLQSSASRRAPMFRPRQRVRCRNTGLIYRIVDWPRRCLFEATALPAYTFTAESGGDITLWVIPQADMEDGRFTPVGDAVPTAVGEF